MKNLTTFQRFWLGINLALSDRGLPEMLFGEARILWQASREA